MYNLFETSQLQLWSKGGTAMRAWTRTFYQSVAGRYWVILKMYAWEKKLECRRVSEMPFPAFPVGHFQ